MPLHDWGELSGWDGVHLLWIAELFRWVKPRLPAGYRVFIGSTPTIAVGAGGERPDVSLRSWPEPPNGAAEPSAAGPAEATGTATEAPDVEVIAAPLHVDTALFVELKGRLVAAVELV